MNGPATTWYLALAAFLFGIGALGVLVRRNPLIVLLSLELMLNGGNLALIAFSRHFANGDGQIFGLGVMAVGKFLQFSLVTLAAVLRGDERGDPLSFMLPGANDFGIRTMAIETADPDAGVTRAFPFHHQCRRRFLMAIHAGFVLSLEHNDVVGLFRRTNRRHAGQKQNREDSVGDECSKFHNVTGFPALRKLSHPLSHTPCPKSSRQRHDGSQKSPLLVATNFIKKTQPPTHTDEI